MSKPDIPVNKGEFNTKVEAIVDETIRAIESGEIDTNDPALVTLRTALNGWVSREGVDRRQAASDNGQAQHTTAITLDGRRQGEREAQEARTGSGIDR
jgi:hypothetical protein